MLRTHTCGQLNKSNLSQIVELSGWVASYRNLGSLLFIDLRDKYGLTQLSWNDTDPSFAEACKLRHEWVIKVKGVVALRPEKMINPKMATGEIEVRVDNLEILSVAEVLPFEIHNDDKLGEVSESLRLKYRFLDLRRPKLQEMLAVKDRYFTQIRAYFHSHGFTEVQTPILANSSPEGARDFLVPSRLYPGKFYALPQAPQQFKQLLMVGGLDRYFQIAPCFRDEDTRVDRHYGEFYQLDMEMSFAGQDDVFAIMEPLMIELTEKFSNKSIINLEADNSFRRLPWREAMTRYGSDKPDLRFDLSIQAVTPLLANSGFTVFDEIAASGGAIHALVVPTGASFSRKVFDELVELAKKKGLAGLAYVQITDEGVKSSLTKFIGEHKFQAFLDTIGAKSGDAVLVGAGPWLKLCGAMGALRLDLASRLNLLDNTKAAWCWIVDYPMYEAVEEGSLAAKQGKLVDFGHNPFSMPQGGLEALIQKNPLEILAYQYDLVLNGFEISSGAVRNQNPELMYKAFAIAGYSQEEVDQKFSGMINAFRYGAPPHAGNAPGLDRLIMVLNDWDSIRDMYAFPKDGQGRDLLMDSPNEVSPEQLKEIGVNLK
jgi:aspartyl-tRNA synthetase